MHVNIKSTAVLSMTQSASALLSSVASKTSLGISALGRRVGSCSCWSHFCSSATSSQLKSLLCARHNYVRTVLVSADVTAAMQVPKHKKTKTCASICLVMLLSAVCLQLSQARLLEEGECAPCIATQSTSSIASCDTVCAYVHVYAYVEMQCCIVLSQFHL